MTVKRSYRPPSQTEASFDHHPTDADAAVYFAGRVITGPMCCREQDGRTVWEISKAVGPTIVVFGFSLWFTVLGLMYWLGDDPPLGYVAFAGAMGMLFLSYFAWWFNHEAAGLNPLLVFDPELKTLQVEGRAEPIATGDVVELLVWNLSGDQQRTLKGDTDVEEPTQASAVVRDDAGYRVVFLYKDRGYDDGRHRRWTPSRVRTLAEKLEVPLRMVPPNAVPRDLRPTNPWMKKPEEITRQFAKQKEV